MAPQQHLVAACAALAILTFAVGLRMLGVRVAEMRARRIPPQAVALSAERVKRLEDSRASDNYNHLFEQPVLFYATAISLAMLGDTSGASLMLAWGYVALRIVHSLWQALVNRIPVRFALFLLSSLALFALVARAALRVF